MNRENSKDFMIKNFEYKQPQNSQKKKKTFRALFGLNIEFKKSREIITFTNNFTLLSKV